MKEKAKNKTKTTLKIIITAIIIFIILYWTYQIYDKIEITPEYKAEKTNYSTERVKTVENWAQKSEKITETIEQVSNSVCGISKLKTTDNTILSTESESKLGLGTGIIVSSNGYILSNSHVTGEKYSTCYITIGEGNTYTGRVVWANKDLDLSITKITAQNLSHCDLGDSDNVKVGETVYAIGNPIGYEFRKTVTSGIISAINRTVKIEENEETTYMSNLIQTDATINPGNSGGPLINSQGEVIGINSVKITTAEGIGFAVPINVIKPVVESYTKKGKFEEATLGISVYDETVAKYFKLENKFTSGIYVAQINRTEASKKLKKGDIITKIDETELKTINDLKKYIYGKKPNDKVTLTIIRNNKEKQIETTLKRK